MRYRGLLGWKGGGGVRYIRGKMAGGNPGGPLKLADLSWREVRGMRGVAVKCIDIAQNSAGEGSVPAPD